MKSNLWSFLFSFHVRHDLYKILCPYVPQLLRFAHWALFHSSEHTVRVRPKAAVCLRPCRKFPNWSGKEIGSRCILALFEGNDASGRGQEPEPGGPGRDYARRCDQSTGCTPHQSSTPEFVCVSSPKYQSILNFLIFKFLNFRIFIFLISQFLKFSILIFEFLNFSI